MMMEELVVFDVFLIKCKKIKGICCEFMEKVWIYGDDEKIK